MQARFKNTIVAPHVDDAEISLGGLMLNDRNERQLVINVFSISDSSEMFKEGEKSTGFVTAMRKREAKATARLTNAKIEFLDLRDAPLRGYKKVVGMPNWRSDKAISAKLKGMLGRAASHSERIFFPIGIRRHVDHVLLARIGLELIIEGHDNVWFYEDLPRAAFPSTFAFIDIKDPEGLIWEMMPVKWLAKSRLIGIYRSQIGIGMRTLSLLYSNKIGGIVSSKERVWRPVDKSAAKRLLQRGL